MTFHRLPGCDVDRVVVSLADARGKLPMYALEMRIEQGVSFDHLATLTKSTEIAVENLRPSWLIFEGSARRSSC
jgi:hypothetical protein